MSVWIFLMIVICGWTSVTVAAPALLTDPEDNISSDNYLSHYTLPNFSELSSDVDVNKTVEQVEAILNANPLLPRLSKEDILILLNNITTEDMLKVKKATEGATSNRSNDGRSLMVVLPYKADDTATGDVTELYTKPPIIRYIQPNNFSFEIDDDSKEAKKPNHKYTEKNPPKKDNSVENFWQNQAQKVMDDLKRQNDKSTTTTETTVVEEIPFKKMPPIKIPFGYINNIPSASGETEDPLSNEDYVVDFVPLPDVTTKPAGKVAKDLVSPDKENISATAPIKYDPTGDVSNPPILQDQMPLESFNTSPDTSGYVAFKPLPLVGEEKKQQEDLNELLEKYGLINPVNNEYLPISALGNPEEVHVTNTDFIEPDMFPNDMTSMLTDLGLMNKKGRKMKDPQSEEKLSNSVSGNDDAILGAGPDPMSVEEIDMSSEDKGSDMIKRQEINVTIEPDVEVFTVGNIGGNDTVISDDVPNNSGGGDSNKESEKSSSEEKEVSTTTTEAPNLKDLENSFGASPADEDPSEAELPPPRKNGFYYMLDWNSFLEVGDGDRKVNIRFNPKLGDPQRFLAVTVP